MAITRPISTTTKTLHLVVGPTGGVKDGSVGGIPSGWEQFGAVKKFAVAGVNRRVQLDALYVRGRRKKKEKKPTKSVSYFLGALS